MPYLFASHVNLTYMEIVGHFSSFSDDPISDFV